MIAVVGPDALRCALARRLESEGIDAYEIRAADWCSVPETDWLRNDGWLVIDAAWSGVVVVDGHLPREVVSRTAVIGTCWDADRQRPWLAAGVSHFGVRDPRTDTHLDWIVALLASAIRARNEVGEIAERLEIYREAFRNVPDGMWIADAQQCFLDANDAFVATRGLQRTELLGKRTGRAGDAAVRAWQRDVFAQVDRGNPGPFAFTRIDARGRSMDLELMVGRHAVNGLTQYTGVVRDVGERNRARREAELYRDSLAALHEIVASQSDSAESKIDRMLRFGLARFGVSDAAVFELDGDAFIVRHAVEHLDRVIKGKRLAIGDIYGREPFRRGHAVGFRDVRETQLGDSVAVTTPMRTYLGAPITVDGTEYGVLGFADPAPRDADFSDAELSLAQLMAEWVGHEIFRAHSQERLAAREQQLRHITDFAADGICRLDPGGRAQFVNPAAARMLGYDIADLIGRPVHETLHHSRSDSSPYPVSECPVHRALKTGQAVTVRDETFWRRDGRALWVDYACTPIVEAGRVTGAVMTFQDVSPRRAIEDSLRQTSAALKDQNLELTELANRDALTGIANRRKFDATLDVELRRAARDGNPVSLILCDIDYFKRYNDCLGHDAGDDCLHRVARHLAGAARRPGDLVARYGGEEFVMLLADTPGAGAMALAEQVREGLAELALPHPASPQSDKVTLSIGIAEVQPGPQNPVTARALVRRADEALYRAKQEGRDRAVLAQ